MTVVVDPEITTSPPWSMPASVSPKVAPLTTLADITEAAADYIDEHGWCQGRTYHLETGEVCAVGGFYGVLYGFDGETAQGERNSRADELNELVGALSVAVPPPVSAKVNCGALISFNDYAGTRKEDVTGYLRRAAATLRARGDQTTRRPRP